MVKKDARGQDKKEILQGSVAEIFSTKVNGSLPARILISAPAGRGKTTAVAKIAYDWVYREKGSALEHLPLLFVVKFRNTSQRTSIGEAIQSQLLSDVDDLTPEDVGIVLVIIFENTFQNDLADPFSTAFINLANALCNRLIEYFTNLASGDIKCEVIRFTSGSVVADVNLTLPANDASQARNIMDNVGIVTAMDIGNIIASNEIYFPTAINSNGAACSPLIFRNASFPDGREGDVVDSSETCPIYTTMGGTHIGRAECAQDSTFGELAWNITMYLNDCGPLRETNEVVDDIIEKGVTNETVIEVLEIVVVVTDTEIDEGDIVNIANIISNSTALQSGDPEITTLTAAIISNFAEKDEEELFAVEENTGAITQILESFEEQLSNLDISDGQSYTALEMNVAVQVTSVEPADFLSGLTVSASSPSSDLSQADITLNAGDSLVTEEVLTGTRVSIPSSVLNDLSSEVGSESGVRVALTVFSTQSLFSSQHIRGTNAGQSSFNRTVNSLVIGLTLGRQKMATLGENIVFKYTPLQSGFQNPECVFWDFEDTLDWSSRGCQAIKSSGSDNGEITCSCDHLTNFAVLMDIYYERVEALRIISIIGCAISIVCLVIILITYLSNKNLHVHQSQKIFMCLCGTLLGLYLTFLIMSALDRHPDYPEVTPVPCGILAALVHFFTLSSMAWMGVEGINTYLIVVRVFDAYIPRFMLKASIVAWGVSGLIVLLTGMASQGNYAATDYCFLQKWPSVGGLLIPIAIILLANIVIFSLVIRRLIKSANVASNSDAAGTKRKASIERIKNAVSVLLLLGLTWVTGYLTLIDTTSQVTQTLFIVFNSLQGFFIFILYCARNPVVRAYWAKVCVCGQDSSKSSTRANQGTSQGISLTKTKSTSENDQSHVYENPSFDDKEYTDLDFSQVKKGGDPTKPTSSGKEYTDLDFSKIEKGGDPTKSFDGKEDVDPAYEVCII
eukprot:XP_011671009.1 PREDICTED: G-protein coupled receptor 126 [Strongylocentrotus purpuratus]